MLSLFRNPAGGQIAAEIAEFPGHRIGVAITFLTDGHHTHAADVSIRGANGGGSGDRLQNCLAGNCGICQTGACNIAAAGDFHGHGAVIFVGHTNRVGEGHGVTVVSDLDVLAAEGFLISIDA